MNSTVDKTFNITIYHIEVNMSVDMRVDIIVAISVNGTVKMVTASSNTSVHVAWRRLARWQVS